MRLLTHELVYLFQVFYLGLKVNPALILILWQAPISAWIFAHMAYGLSTQLQNTYATVGAMVNNVNTAFATTTWWYGVTFPEWNGLRVEQDPVYVAYTNLYTEPGGAGGVFALILIVGVVGVIWVMVRRRR